MIHDVFPSSAEVIANANVDKARKALFKKTSLLMCTYATARTMTILNCSMFSMAFGDF
jgi:hypothetical protein